MVLTKVLYLINTGETFSNEEAVDLFFAVTKLFQSPDVHLRRMVYLIIKELKIESDSSLIVVSCLSKDMTSKIDLFRANSIRVLAKIMDVSRRDMSLAHVVGGRNWVLTLDPGVSLVVRSCCRRLWWVRWSVF
jgi:hypothetical protein